MDYLYEWFVISTLLDLAKISQFFLYKCVQVKPTELTFVAVLFVS